MRPFFCLLFFTIPVSAEPAGSAPLLIERGLMQQRHLHHPAHAAALYREALTAGDRTPRTSAEALWHLSGVYSHRGAERVSLLMLSKLQHDCPGVEPFTRLAAAESIAISTDDAGNALPRDGPNAVDLMAARDTVWLLEAAVQLKHETAVTTLTRELRWHCEAMVFELSIGETTETASERKEREHSLETCQDWLSWAEQSTPPGPGDPAAAEIRDPEFLSHDPMLADIFDARDDFTAAIGRADAAAAAKARDSLRALVAPVTRGPEELLIVKGYRGELAGMARAIALLEKSQAPAALTSWAESRRVFHESGAGTSGFHLEDMDDLPRVLLPEIMGALTFVENAITDLINEDADGIGSAQASLETAIDRIGRIAATCREPKGQKRLEKTIRRLRDAGEKLEQEDTAGAEALMRSELYGSL